MKILYVTTIGKTMRFFETFIKSLIEEGHCVDIATNEEGSPVPESYRALGCNVFQVCFSRTPISSGNVSAYGQLRKIVENGGYDVVHCHTPNASVITRLVCRSFRKKNGLKVFYTAHGFHFYKGAPKFNWMVYYPVEKICSHFTDKLITINREDFRLAERNFKAREVHYIPGVGLDFTRFENVPVDNAAKRREIGVPEDAFLLLSVGELNENKNHQIIIRALAQLNDPGVHYAIAGIGNKKESLLALASNLGISDRVHLLGYRSDIPALNHAADVFCFPSLREGLGLAAIEAMACGLPLVTSNVHGINDYSVDGVTGYQCPPCSAEAFAEAISKIKNEDLDRFGTVNRERAKDFSLGTVLLDIRKLYES